MLDAATVRSFLTRCTHFVPGGIYVDRIQTWHVV